MHLWGVGRCWGGSGTRRRRPTRLRTRPAGASGWVTGPSSTGCGAWRRRVLRLVPALTVMMAGFLAVSFVGERYEPTRLLSSTGWVLGFMTNLAIDRPIEEVSNTWSLSVEAHF